MPAQNSPAAGKWFAGLQTVLPFLFPGLWASRLFSDGNIKLFFGYIYHSIQCICAKLFPFQLFLQSSDLFLKILLSGMLFRESLFLRIIHIPKVMVLLFGRSLQTMN